jgi:hypothetical protein
MGISPGFMRDHLTLSIRVLWTPKCASIGLTNCGYDANISYDY